MGWLNRILGRGNKQSGTREDMRRKQVVCVAPGGLHHMAYSEWGREDNPRVLICVHGLTRNGRDFDDFARAMSSEYRVICPDVAGRGQSQWLRQASDYVIPTYVADMVTLMARAGVEEVDWVGTSMGGLIGMALAALDGSPVRRLVLNDVGPEIAAVSLRRIGEYVGQMPHFADMAAAETYVRTISATFGPLTDAQWHHLTEHSLRALPDGGYTFAYDPAIAEPFRSAFVMHQNIDLWPIYDAIRCPTMVVRGVESDLLTPQTLTAMSGRGPQPETVEFEGVGHAPMLMDEAQINTVRRFLLAGQPTADNP